MEINKKFMKAAAMAGVVILAGAAGAVGHASFSEPVVVEKTVTKEVIVPGPTEVQTVEVPVEKEVLVEKEVRVEVPLNGTDDVLEFLIDQNGDLRELDIDEIEDRGFDELINQVAFIRESKLMAANFVDKELADELDRRKVGGVILDEDDIERVRVQDDLDELLIDDIDFEDMDADVTVFATFEHDDVEYEAEFLVEIKDGSIDDLEVVDVRVA